MQSNILTEIFLPLALIIIMLGMGLSLTLHDFRRVVVYPRATFIGVTGQIVVLPLIAFFALQVIGLPPALSVGVMLLAFCPGGPTSNLLSNLARADLALSITLTAITSIITVFTIPILLNYAMQYFIGEGKYVELPVVDTMIQILVITIIPVSVGMLIRWKSPRFADKSEKPVKIASALFITLIILGVIVKEKDNLAGYFAEVGIVMLLINVIVMATSYGVGVLFKLKHRQCATISIETGIQNGTLAIAIATSSLLLNNSEMSIPAAVYSLIMFMTGGVAVWLFRTMSFRKDLATATAPQVSDSIDQNR